MQWLTAILAFATTMLIFAIVVSALVEVIHQVFGSRTFGLISMLEHYYDEVLSNYFDAKKKKDSEVVEPKVEVENKITRISRTKFLASMVTVRAPGVYKNRQATFAKAKSQGVWDAIFWTLGLLPQSLKYVYGKLSRTSKIAADLGHSSSWRLLNSLPVETFMERLGTLGFSDVLDNKKLSTAEKDTVLKDIAQKFELYGRESTLYFETKAGMFSVIVALLVAWTFYVHPYNLIRTYMTNPAVAAKVAELREDSVEKFEEQKKALTIAKEAQQGQTSSKKIEELLDDVEKELKQGKEQVQLLNAAGAPIGWPTDMNNIHQFRLFCRKKIEECNFILNLPKSPKDIFWLLIGGVLIGLGAPFWAKSITQIGRAKDQAQNITSILKPQTQKNQGIIEIQSAPDRAEQVPLTTEAFKAAAEARKSMKTPRE